MIMRLRIAEGKARLWKSFSKDLLEPLPSLRRRCYIGRRFRAYLPCLSKNRKLEKRWNIDRSITARYCFRLPLKGLVFEN